MPRSSPWSPLSISSLALVGALAGCQGDGAVPCGELEPRNPDEVALCNELDYAVLAHVAWPEGEPPPGGFPAVVMLHGSGGLFHSASAKADDVCTEELQDQFLRWEELLTAAGYAVVMPASFYSRGFCDWTEAETVPPRYTPEERLVTRVFDAYAAGEWACDQAEIDCDRLALLGFSNGASTSLLAMHEALAAAKDSRLRGLDQRDRFRGAVSYYPGCSLYGQVTVSTDAERLDEFYFPAGPVLVQHAERDPLLESCRDLRLPQTSAVTDARGMSPEENPFELVIWPGADHGFDVPTLESSDADVSAFWAATESSLDHLAGLFL